MAQVSKTTIRSSTAPASQVVFWIFYALIGFWLDLSLSVTFWVLSLVLPFTLPFVLAIGGSKGLSQSGFVLVPGDLFYGQSDNLIYTEAGIISVPGLSLVVIAVLTLKLWFKSHLAMFRHLGGAIILLTEPYPLALLGILLLGGAILLVFPIVS